VAVSSPPIDQRTGPDIVSQLEKLMSHYAPEVDATQGLAAALAGIFGRFAELIIERLNRVPEKNFLAFVDLLGASPSPPQPARAPITFSLAAGSAVDGVVPAGTQVAAAPAEGEEAPVVFETERELVVTAAQLTSVFARSPEQDKFADYSVIADSSMERGVPMFLGNQNIEHILFLGHETLFTHGGLKTLRLSITVSNISDPDPFEVFWERWDGVGWASLGPPPRPGPVQAFSVQSRSNGGSVSPLTGGIVTLAIHSPFLLSEVAGITNYWLRCRLTTPITSSADPRMGMVRAESLPEITEIKITASSSQADMVIEHAFANAVLLDTTKDFLPFGDKPRLGDALYLSVNEAFSEAGSVVTLDVELAKPGRPSTDLLLKWDLWNGKWQDIAVEDGTVSFTQNNGAIKFTVPNSPEVTAINGVEGFWIRARIASGNYGDEAQLFEPVTLQQNDTAKLVSTSPPLDSFRLRLATFQPPVIKSIAVKYTLSKTGVEPGGILTYNDFKYENVTGAASFKPFTPTLDAAPSLYIGFRLPPTRQTFPNRKISMFSLLDEHKYGENPIPVSPVRSRMSGAPGATVVHSFVITNPDLDALEFDCEVAGTAWVTSLSEPTLALGPDPSTVAARSDPTARFRASEPRSKGLMVTVTIPDSAPAGISDRGYLTFSVLPDRQIQYAAVFETLVGETQPANARVQLEWGYSIAGGYSKLLIRDESLNFGRPGLTEFLGPADFSLREEFGVERFWLRSVWKSGHYPFEPLLHRLLLNTTMASQRVTITNEVLGSSDGSKNQKFRTIQAPVLQGPTLEVLEPEQPSAAEQDQIRKQAGDDVVSPVREGAGGSRQVWVRWSEVPDFYGSAARDRHYVMEHLTGEIRFGDGQNGLIPPPGSGSIRLASYQTGGGATGNKPAGSISQLKTTVPYVEKATNHIAATGGADAEKTDSFLDHAPRIIRHGGRAVTFEDFQDVAKLASPDVARAKCVPLCNLLADPEGSHREAGIVSLIVVPRSSEAKPMPGLEMINRVREFFAVRQSIAADLIVVGPEYVRVSVNVEIAVASLEAGGEVELAVDQALTRFLHPLTGGLDGRGWDFGRKPHKSDLYALIEDVPGVDHVRLLVVEERDDRTGLAPPDSAGLFLVYSGAHSITLRFDEP